MIDIKFIYNGDELNFITENCKDLMHCSYKLTHTDLVEDLLGKWYASTSKRPHLWKKKEEDKLINYLEKCLEPLSHKQVYKWEVDDTLRKFHQGKLYYPSLKVWIPQLPNPYSILIINSDWIWKWFYSFAFLFEKIIHSSIDMAHKLNCARFYS